MDRSAFFAALRTRNGVFGTSLSQRQVDGTEPLLDAGEGLSIPHMAHVLAEVYHETGSGMYPVKETVFHYSSDKNPSDATVIARLDRAFAKGQLTWVKTPYWRDGAFGRGQIQITHWDNYERLSSHVGVDLRANPEKALIPAVSAKIAVEGCRHGLFRGHKLADYDGSDGYDHHAARDIVNGDVRAVGPKVAKYAAAFEDALDIAGWGASSAPVDVDDEVETLRAAIANRDDKLARIAAILMED